MNIQMLSVGVSGHLPAWHPYLELAARDTASAPPLILPPALRRERKASVLVEAAHHALTNAEGLPPEVLARCALVVVTSYDGQPTNKIDPETNTHISFADMAPTSVAFSFVSHMASSCVSALLHVHGPSVTLGSREGMTGAIRLAKRWLAGKASHVLAIETDLALPDGVGAQLPVPSDYALALLLGRGGVEHGSSR